MTDLSRVRLLGVDWSTIESKRGIAIVDSIDGACSIIHLVGCSSRRTALTLLSEAIAEAPFPCVLAIDAPLGWPVQLQHALEAHRAGEGLLASADAMFARETDRFVWKTLKKRPLEVGANFIARTAHSANQFLRDLRLVTSRPIPLLWSPDELSTTTGAIEVYPAAAKLSVGDRSIEEILGLIEAPSCMNEHVEDALWCAVSALHFVRRQCHAPSDPETSRREGWIWFRQNASS